MKRRLFLVSLLLVLMGVGTGYLYVRLEYGNLVSFQEEIKRKWEYDPQSLTLRRYLHFEKSILPAIQKELGEGQSDGWLCLDQQGANPVAYALLPFNDLGSGSTAEAAVRRHFFIHPWIYFIPTKGIPTKIIHPLDARQLEGILGKECLYLNQEDWDGCLVETLLNSRRISMEMTENGEPVVRSSGMWRIIHEKGIQLLSSRELIRKFLNSVSKNQVEQHRQAMSRLQIVARQISSEIKERWDSEKRYTIGQVKESLRQQMERTGLQTSFPPLVSSGKDTCIPYYSPGDRDDKKLLEGEVLQLEIAGRLPEPDAVYAKIAWIGYLDKSVPQALQGALRVCLGARKELLGLLQEAYLRRERVSAGEMEGVVRQYYRLRGVPGSMRHAIGHILGPALFGFGSFRDSVLQGNEISVGPDMLFTVETGFYTREFGVRTAINVAIGEQGVEVTTASPQEEIIAILN